MSSVELIDVSKTFGNVEVVQNITLQVQAGEFLVLVGPSGCGKSTCLRMIAGLESVTAGKVCLGGRVVNDVAPKDRDIGMVFQSYALYPHMTVRENLGFGLLLQKSPRTEIDKRVSEVATMLELGALLDRRPKELSGGQRQRVAMGRAIVRQPDVFLFDEPLSNLDAALRVQMRGEIAALHQRLESTMVYVTHDQVEAMTLASRIAVLQGGKLQQVGAPMELYTEPANRFVAGFLGSPPMAFLEGHIELQGDALSLAQDECSVRVRLPNHARAYTGAGSLGVRPHALSLCSPEEAAIAGQVVAVEAMGWESWVHVKTPAGTLVMRLAGGGGGVRVGETVHLGVDPSQVYVFDQDGRRRHPSFKEP